MADLFLSRQEEQIVAALSCGALLKVHRTLDGEKNYLLHPLDEAPHEALAESVVESLVEKRVIASNMKFPAATFLLTDRGLAAANKLGKGQRIPVASRLYE